MIKHFLYEPGEGVTLGDGIADFRSMTEKENAVLWVDLLKPTDEESYILTHDFNFHPLAIEDVISEKPRTKLDDYDRYLFLVFQIVDYIGREEGLKASEVDMFLTKNALVTVHYDEHRMFDYLYHRAERDERLMSRGADFLFHAVIDTVVDNYNATLDILEYEVDRIEDDVLEALDEDTLRSIFTLRRDIIQLRRIVIPQKEVVLHLSQEKHPQITQRASLYFSDVYDHLVRVDDLANFHREILNSSLEIYYSSISTRTNEAIKVLTMLSVIFIPPTFLVGLWGMNFDFMPELRWRYGYWAALTLIFLIVMGLLIYFRKKKWI